MGKLQKIFNRFLQTKKEIREIKKMYRDALNNSANYKQVMEELAVLKDRKKKIEDNIKEDFRVEMDKLDTLKTDLESDKMLLSDVVINKIVKGELIEVQDQYENKHEPIFSVRFKKR